MSSPQEAELRVLGEVEFADSVVLTFKNYKLRILR